MKFNFNWKKCLKILGILVAILLVLIIIVLLTLPWIVKGGVQHVGPLITGVPMEVKSVSYNPFEGTFTIKDFTVGNPQGYSSPYAMKLEHLHVDVAMTTLFSKKLLIERIEVKGVKLNYETAVLKNNIQEILDNVNKFAGESKEKEKESAKKEEDAASKPLQIDYLELDDITAWVIVKGTKAKAPLPVAPIKMTKLGTGEDGVTSVMVINDVLVSMVTGVTKLIGADAAFQAVGDFFTGKKEEKKK